MESLILNHEKSARLLVFVFLLLLFMALEFLLPRKKRELSRRRRWPANLSVVILNTLILRLLFPAAGLGMALWTQTQGWGLFNQVGMPALLLFLLSLLILDLAIYGQHLLMHKLPVLWRMHRMHHADLDIDVTTGLRFHPLEIVLSMLIKFLVILVLGPSPAAVIVFEILLNATSLFNHSNLAIKTSLDRVLRKVLVTPDMHRVHHSRRRDETNSNYGFNLPWWDYLFATYHAQPVDGHDDMIIGIPDWTRESDCTHLPGMLVLPFRRL